MSVKGAVLQFIPSVPNEKFSVHFIAMAEIVVHTAQIQEILQCHLVLSSINKTQNQPHLSHVTIKNASEQIHKDMVALELLPHLWAILPMRVLN